VERRRPAGIRPGRDAAYNRGFPALRRVMARSVPLVIYVHLFAALAALLLGTWQLLRPKGTSAHKATGWAWVLLMLTVAISSLWIPSFLHFSWIHLFTLLTLITLPVAIVAIRRGNVARHAGAMRGLYIGGLLVAGVFTAIPGRLIGNLVFKGTWGY
jgi:uncharacterized membrane protein